MKGHIVMILNKLKKRFPNLRIAYLSSRIYAGYAKSALNPEPYAYESGFRGPTTNRTKLHGKRQNGLPSASHST